VSLLANLPEVNFADQGPAEVESAVITVYENLTHTTLYPGDPVRLFLEALAYIISGQNAVIDAAGKQNLLAYAKEDHLDHLGALMDTFRLTPQAAVTTLRFSLAAALAWPVEIPWGSRVATGEGKLIFATDRAAAILAGAIHVDVPATCQKPGLAGNNLVPGQINAMVDPLAYIDRVENIITSHLGSDREEDALYRTRIQLAPEHFSVAGPEGAYRYHTLSVHPDIVDCSVWRPRPGVVDVRPVLKGGELPSAEMLDAVRARLNDKLIRPLTDTVIVAAPEAVPYAIRGGWFLARNDEPLAETRKRGVAAALEEFRIWQRSRPGRDINPTKLISLLERAGAKRVVLEEPDFAALEDWHIARETSVEFEFLGVEND
jgi:phage-related baseplate assembly protein